MYILVEVLIYGDVSLSRRETSHPATQPSRPASASPPPCEELLIDQGIETIAKLP